MNFAQKSGTRVIEKKYEAKMEMTTPSARSVKMYWLTPLSRKTGKKTMEVANGGGEHGERNFLTAFGSGLDPAVRPLP